jgi:hypothetical protein
MEKLPTFVLFARRLFELTVALPPWIWSGTSLVAGVATSVMRVLVGGRSSSASRNHSDCTMIQRWSIMAGMTQDPKFGSGLAWVWPGSGLGVAWWGLSGSESRVAGETRDVLTDLHDQVEDTA